uniref:CCHC-type domain-containing protein n=1 Tax=Meloidogyne hapla TaxID=6305 RepID=A0A1I8BX71_MELHA
MQNATSDFSKKQGVNSFPCTFPLSTPLRPQVNSITPQSGFGTIPPPNLGSKQFHPSNSNLHWRMPPPYQASGPAAPILRNPGTLPIICDYCGRDGHTLEVCPSLPKTVHTQDQRVIRNKKIRKAEDRQRLQQLDKLKMKRKAEKYTVRRNDPLIQRLRSVAPHGKITKDHIRLICQRCGGLGHIWNECARPEVPRSTLKSINEKMEEFIKIFFVHLNDDNLVDFSEKFELFIIMDGIENNGTVDPVGLQLQSSCNRGIVTKGDLRDLCKNCATIGHSPADCRQKTICSRQHYEKMLKLVDAYRALVKEGNGNFFLPRLNQSQNQKNPHTSNININNTYSTTIRRVTKEPEIVLVDSDDEESKDKRKNNRKK